MLQTVDVGKRSIDAYREVAPDAILDKGLDLYLSHRCPIFMF